MEIQKANQSLTINEVDKSIIQIVGRELFKLNLVVSYPYSDELIEFMAKTILRLDKKLDIIELSELIDDFLTGKIKYTKDNGISLILKELSNRRLTYKPTQNNSW